MGLRISGPPRPVTLPLLNQAPPPPSGGRGAENAEKWKNLEEIVTKWKKFAIFGLAYKID